MANCTVQSPQSEPTRRKKRSLSVFSKQSPEPKVAVIISPVSEEPIQEPYLPSAVDLAQTLYNSVRSRAWRIFCLLTGNPDETETLTACDASNLVERPAKRARYEAKASTSSSVTPALATTPPRSAASEPARLRIQDMYVKTPGKRLMSQSDIQRRDKSVIRAQSDARNIYRRNHKKQLRLANRWTDLSPLHEDPDESDHRLSRLAIGTPTSLHFRDLPRHASDTSRRDHAMAQQQAMAPEQQEPDPTIPNSTSEPVAAAKAKPVRPARSPVGSPRPLPQGRWHHYAIALRAKKDQIQKEKDAKVDGLIQRARLARAEKPEVTTIRRELQLKKEREAKARQVQEERQKEIQRLATEAKAKIDQERRVVIRKKQEQSRAQEAGIKKPRSRQSSLERSKKARSPQSSRQASEEPSDDKRIDIIKSLDEDWSAKVEEVLNNNGHADTVIATGTNNVPLMLKTFKRMLGDGGVSAWLDDDAINAFIHAFVDALNKAAGWTKSIGKVPPYAAFNSAWWTSYSKGGYGSIKNWAKRQGIQGERLLQAKAVFFPINTGMHWTLVVVNPLDKTIAYLDSLSGAGNKEVAAARDWLAQELGPAYKESQWSRSRARSQKQDNGSDCGVFTCYNALAAAQGVSYRVVTADKMADARRQMAAVFINGGFKDDFKLVATT